MSAEPRSPEHSVQCEHCRGPRDPTDSVGGSYCSPGCYYRAKGGGVLDDIQNDGTVCSTCFARLAETDEPTEGQLRRAGVSKRVRDAFAGYRHSTPRSTRADGAPHRATPDRFGVLREHPSTHTPRACECGTIDEPDGTIARVEGAAVLLNLWRELCRRYDSGGLDREPSREDLFDGLRDAGERDWAYAIGRCLYG